MFGLANTPLINYFFYKQSTTASSSTDTTTFPILSIADGGNGQLVITTDDTSLLTAGVAITIEGTPSYNGNYTVLSLTPTTFNVSGVFGLSETGTWKLALNITGAQVGDPLDFGKVFFFDNTDKVTPLSTFSDRALTIPNTNPIVLDAVGSSPPIYLQDKPYFIRIIDKFNNLVATLDNYLPPGGRSTGTLEVPLGNLIGNYGFDTRINENIFSEVSVGANSTSAVSAGWFWEIATTEADPQNTYEYIELGNSNLPGNPKNELLLKSTNNTAGQTVNNLYTVIGDYNKFQGQELTLAIFTRLQSGSPGTIPVSLVRLKNGVPQTAIPLGDINIATLRTQEFLTFTPPDLTTSAFDNDDEMRLVFGLPLNMDFQYAFTGVWLQLGPLDGVAISEDAGSQDAAKEFFGRSFRPLQADPQYPNRGLPIGIGLGEATVLNQTGAIFQALTANPDNFNFAVSMGTKGQDSPSVELIRNKVIKNTQTNRLIDFLRDNNFTQSRLTFLASHLLNVVSVELGIGAVENSTWNSLAAPRITLTQANPAFDDFKISADCNGDGEVLLTFADNFNAATNPYNPSYGAPINDTLFDPGNPPSGPIIVWIGGASFTNFTTHRNVFNLWVGATVISNGSVSEPAQVRVSLPTNTSTHFLRFADSAVTPNVLGYGLEAGWFTYQGADDASRIFDTVTSPSFGVGYLGYNDIANNPATQGFNPPRVIRFGSAASPSNAPTGLISTADIPTPNGATSEQLCASMVATLNTSFKYEITIASTPNNGDIVEISNATTDFNLIYYDLAQSKPVNSGLAKPFL